MPRCDYCRCKYKDDELTGVLIRKNRKMAWGHLCPDCLKKLKKHDK